ncbi:MAG: immunoglobulin domain-containing protein [Verrucomicrobiota bacterium]
MKQKFLQITALALAAMLQMAPLLRSVLPAQGLAPSAWGFILKIGVGATALLSFDAVSQASSISISPANATVGVPYVGTVSYSGGHSGTVASMMLSNNCLSSAYPLGNGLSIIYAGGNTATVTGTPLAANPNQSFSVTVWNGICGGKHSDTRTTSLVVGASGSNQTAPVISAAPLNTCAQVGSTIQLSGGASGYPIPQYQWWQGLAAIPGATNSILTLTNVQLSNAGLYTLTASNLLNAGNSFLTLPKANCYLTICISPGTNYAALDYTNYVPAGVPLTMYCFQTNVTTSSNYYNWYYNNGSSINTANTLQFSAAQALPSKGGVYTVRLDSTNASGYLVTNQQYESYWAFGYPPLYTNQLPAATSVNAGTNVTYSVSLQGTLNVYIPGGAVPATTNAGVPCVFWYKNGGLIASQSYTNGPTTGTTFSNSIVNASLTLNNVSSVDSGSYTVVTTNYWGSITSTPAVLTVASPGFAPGFALQPPPALALLAGQSSAISVTVTGTPPFYYQWRKAGTNLANGGAYGGVFTNALTLSHVATNNSGNYTVVVTNSVGTVTSSVTALNIALPPKLVGAFGSPGLVQFTGSSVTNLTYVILSATNLVPATWLPVQTNNTGSGGIINFQTNVLSQPNNFYRIMFP